MRKDHYSSARPKKRYQQCTRISIHLPHSKALDIHMRIEKLARQNVMTKNKFLCIQLQDILDVLDPPMPENS